MIIFMSTFFVNTEMQRNVENIKKIFPLFYNKNSLNLSSIYMTHSSFSLFLPFPKFFIQGEREREFFMNKFMDHAFDSISECTFSCYSTFIPFFPSLFSFRCNGHRVGMFPLHSNVKCDPIQFEPGSQ